MIRNTPVSAAPAQHLAWVPRRRRSAMLGTALAAGLAVAVAVFTAASLLQPQPATVVMPIAAPERGAAAAPAVLPAALRLTLAGMTERLAQLGAENRRLREEIEHLVAERDALRRQVEAAAAEPIVVLEARKAQLTALEDVSPPVGLPTEAEPAVSPLVTAPAAQPAPPPAEALPPVVQAAPEAAPPPALSTNLAQPAPNAVRAGAEAYRQGDFARAFAIWQPLAEQGVARAQFHLAALYLEGRVGPVDLLAARAWAMRARAGGMKLADNLLATIEARLDAQRRPDLPTRSASTTP